MTKHHRWQERWDLNQQDGLAVHDSGLRVRLHEGVGLADNAAEVEHSLLAQHGAHNAPAMVRRLTREGAQMLIDPGARGWRGG
jgi:hypothetical protein